MSMRSWRSEWAFQRELIYGASHRRVRNTIGTYSIFDNWLWRIPSVVQLVSSLTQLTLIWFVSESPRWIVSRDRHEEVFEILVKYHTEDDRDSAFIRAESEEIQRIVSRGIEALKGRCIELVQTPCMRKGQLSRPMRDCSASGAGLGWRRKFI